MVLFVVKVGRHNIIIAMQGCSLRCYNYNTNHFTGKEMVVTEATLNYKLLKDTWVVSYWVCIVYRAIVYKFICIYSTQEMHEHIEFHMGIVLLSSIHVYTHALLATECTINYLCM